jgi:ketosteroid isomerase-like protein
MSQENVEIVRTIWEGVNRGDAAALAMFDSDVVYESDLLPDHVGETYRGSEGVVKAWSLWTEAWDPLDTDVEWVRDAGRHEVVSCHQARMRGRGSGINAELRYAYLWRFRDGKVIYCKGFRDPSEALETVGLSDQDAHTDS